MTGKAGPSEIDVRKLDVGNYVTEPAIMGEYSIPSHFAAIESARMADAVVDPFEADPALKFGWGAKMITDSDSAIDLLANVTSQPSKSTASLRGSPSR
ncbi:hypothetical protein FOY51_18175 [Antrihabitans cavernicola]|uniref:DUF7373 domain-containing protein n=1 Tax=Antrihabitans cavernicola TaxID=2495913 RepID=A0A5A7SB78_9NOCA|nr:hypothetical protein FOY51_18175 [Spelaeibacter cavernicola]